MSPVCLGALREGPRCLTRRRSRGPPPAQGCPLGLRRSALAAWFAGCSMACAPVPARRRQSWGPESGYTHRRALEKLATLEISYPMMFEVTNPRYLQRRLHCGVLEFIAQEGHTHCHAHCHAHCRTHCIHTAIDLPTCSLTLRALPF